MYCCSEVCKSIVTSVNMELPELPEGHTLDFDKPKEVAEPISHYYASIPPATSRALKIYMQTKHERLVFSYLIHDHFLKFFQHQLHFVQKSVETVHHSSTTLFPQYTRSFLHNVNELVADDTQATTAFHYIRQHEFSALSEIVKELLARREVATCPTSNTSTEQPLLYLDVAHAYSSHNP